MKVLCIILASLCLSAMPIEKLSAANELKIKIIGKWEVHVPEAFPGFQNYILHIREINHEMVVDIQGVEIDVKEMKFIEKDGKLNAHIYINGELSKVIIWEENGAIKGSQEGLPWIFKKVKL